MQHLILIIITTVAIATILNVALKRINIPTVIGYIITGAIIGPLFHIEVHGHGNLEHIAEFGIVFLMFTIGLEFSVAHLKEMKKEVFLYGALQVHITGLILAALAVLVFDMPAKTALIVGLGLALSSTAIVLKLLNESGKIKTDYGRNALGVLIFQDIAVIPILLMITIFTNQDKSLITLLTETTINATIALLILIVVGRLVLNSFFKVVANTNSKEIYMGSILLVVIGASTIAHNFGFSYSLGAFIAGMMIADTIYKYQVEADLIPFRDLLLGVFFVSVGLQIDFTVVLQNILPILLLGSAIMFLKAVVTFCILIFSCDKRTSLRSAITLAQVGEFSLVVFSLLLSNSLMDSTSVQVVMVTIVLSMIATPFLLNYQDKIVNLLTRGSIVQDIQEQSEIVGNYVILCGYNGFGHRVSERLDQSGINHIIITDSTDEYIQAREDDKTIIFGDPADRQLLNKLNISDAMSIVVADDFQKVKQVSAAVTLIDPKQKIIAKAANEEECNELRALNHDFVLDGNNHVAGLLVDEISKSQMLAKETAKLQFLNKYSTEDMARSIELIKNEQARLLDIISHSFKGLRENKDIMHLKAFHLSFDALSEIIRKTIEDALNQKNLAVSEYEQINTLLDNQRLLENMNSSMEGLAHDLIKLRNSDQTKSLSKATIEGLDFILLTLKDIANQFNQNEMTVFETLTSAEGDGQSKIREFYLHSKRDLEPDTKALLLSATNSIDHLRQLFASVGNNYRKLAIH